MATLTIAIAILLAAMPLISFGAYKWRERKARYRRQRETWDLIGGAPPWWGQQ